PMLVVGAIGLVVNLAALLLLRSGASESLNVKARPAAGPWVRQRTGRQWWPSRREAPRVY
ncbi:hypothetical protein ACWEJ6_54365, partial [Nonomuraea sp. NPDC004702]